MNRIDVVGIGNALVDIQAQVDEAFPQTVGFEKGIMTLVDDERQAKVIEQLGGKPLHRCAGGSAANSIVGLAQLGGTGGFIGKVGEDEIGRFYSEDMRSLGITTQCTPADVPTGTCAILITPDAQRTMLTNLGAAGLIAKSDIDEDLIRSAKYVYVEGYLLTSPVGKEGAYHAMEVAKSAGVKVALTASDPFLINMIRDEIWDLIRGPVDLFFCNEEEAKSLTGCDDALQAGFKIHESAENVALTLGDKGSLLMHKSEGIPIEGVAVDAIDTTGAGDMYAGALLYGITNGMTWQNAGKLASRKSAEVVAQMGPRLP